MIPQGVPIYVATQPVDLRYGMERLGGLVREWMGFDPRSAGLYVFIGKRRTGLKLLTCDRTGQILVSKKLDAGVFASSTRWGGTSADCVSSELSQMLSEAMFADLFAGSSAQKSKQKSQRITH